jgi:two-component system, NarL family, invasion response regulator UvrY
MYKVAITDDHTMLRKGLANLINTFDGYNVVVEAGNGKELMQKLDSKNLPDIALLDVHMPEMDGYETAEWLRNTYPQVNILALSMMDSESAIIRMIKNGARGYILKDMEPSELKEALNAVITKGYYYNDLVTGKLIFSINKLGSEEKEIRTLVNLSEKEIQFLKLAATEMTYKEIADRMNVGVRTIDGYRDALFEKLNVRSRVGLVIFAIKNGVIII